MSLSHLQTTHGLITMVLFQIQSSWHSPAASALSFFYWNVLLRFHFCASALPACSQSCALSICVRQQRFGREERPSQVLHMMKQRLQHSRLGSVASDKDLRSSRANPAHTEAQTHCHFLNHSSTIWPLKQLQAETKSTHFSFISRHQVSNSIESPWVRRKINVRTLKWTEK